MDEKGNKIIDFQKNNLHVVGYSIPVDQEMSLQELQKHLFSLPDMPEAIPYVTSYYNPRWGFCLTDNQRKTLINQRYRVVIDSQLSPGSLTYADLLIPGKSEEEVFISTYTCHPSMANNELSGPVLATFLAKWLKNQDNLYTYRFVFAPETIGPLVYLSRHLQVLRTKTIAAFNLSCVGDDREVSFLPSRKGNTLTDKLARHVLKQYAPEYKEYNFLRDRGSDERQYCAPGIDLPMVLIMRSKFRSYPEYHTSLDDLSVISPAGLQTSFDLHKKCLTLLEVNKTYRTTIIGEPQLSRRGLDTQTGGHTMPSNMRIMIQNFLMCSDGSMDLITIAEEIGVYAGDLLPVVSLLLENELIENSATQYC
jgi:aminopeptidase-like protein